MSKQLQDYLMQYAIESGEVVDPTAEEMGAEEITVITDETQSELEEAIADMADDVESIADNDQAAEKMVEAVESLESYVGQLNAMIEAEQSLEPVAAGFFVRGVRESLEARGIPGVIFDRELEEVSESFEAFDKEKALTTTKEVAGKAESVIKRLMNMLIAAAKAAVEAIKSFIQRLGTSSTAVKAAGKRLSDLSKGVKGEASKLKGSSYGLLVIGGKVDAPAAIAKAISVYNGNVKPAAEGVNKALEKVTAVLSGDPTKEAVEHALKEAAAALPAAFSAEIGGGYKAEFTHGEGESALKGAKFAVVKSGNVKVDEEIDALSAADIGKLGAELTTLGGVMEASTKAANDAIKASEAAVSKAQSFSKGDKAGGSMKELVDAARSVVGVAQKFTPLYMKHVGGMAKAAYKLGVASAAAHKESKPEGEGAAA